MAYQLWLPAGGICQSLAGNVTVSGAARDRVEFAVTPFFGEGEEDAFATGDSWGIAFFSSKFLAGGVSHAFSFHQLPQFVVEIQPQVFMQEISLPCPAWLIDILDLKFLCS